MFNAKHFCFCLSLYMGCFCIVVFTLIFGVGHAKFVLLLYKSKYPANTQGSDDDFNSLLLHAAPEGPAVTSTVSLLIYGLNNKKPYALVYLISTGLHLIYFTIMLIVSIALGKNIVINEAEDYIHLFWPFCTIRLSSTLYFIYVVICYLKQNEAKANAPPDPSVPSVPPVPPIPPVPPPK